MIAQLKQAFLKDLPGTKAQYRMAHASRLVPKAIPIEATESAVLVLFYPEQDDDWHLVLIERTSNNSNDRHAGQISFPGGRREPDDIDIRATSLRETEEEIGVLSSNVQILGALTSLYIPVSNFKVQPFVGVLLQKPVFIPQESEVKHILLPSVKSLQDKNNIRFTDMNFTPRLTVRKIPYYSVDNRIVWGATAMIISEVLTMLQRA